MKPARHYHLCGLFAGTSRGPELVLSPGLRALRMVLIINTSPRPGPGEVLKVWVKLASMCSLLYWGMWARVMWMQIAV